MYDIEKIQRKIVYITCTDSPNTWKNSNLLNVQYHENQWKFEYIRRTEWLNSWKKSNFLNVQNHQNLMEN